MGFTRAQREQIRCTGKIAAETGERDCVTIMCEYGVRPAWQGLTDRQSRIMLRYVWLCAGWGVGADGRPVRLH